MPQSIHLKSYLSPKEVLINITRLTEEYSKEFKRAPKSALVYSSRGIKSEETYDLAIWTIEGAAGANEVEFFRSKL